MFRYYNILTMKGLYTMTKTRQIKCSQKSFKRFLKRLINKGYVKTINNDVIKVWYNQPEGNIYILIAKLNNNNEYNVAYDTRFIKSLFD